MRKFLLSMSLLIASTGMFAQRYSTPAVSREEQLNKQYCSPLFSSAHGTYFDLENDDATFSASSYFNILDWLQGRVAGLQVYTFRGTRVPFIRNSAAAIYVDEIRVDPGFLNLLPVADIAMVKVIKSPFLGGWGSGSGVIAIYTKTGEEATEEI